ncbi:MAG: fatty acid CoA ligase family protein [bacterium]|nr:fatty acid CoA ligase family protein [bacterium]
MSKSKSANKTEHTSENSNTKASIEANTGHLLSKIAAQLPQNEAIIFPQKGKMQGWTYEHLNQTADAFAFAMQKAGVQPGSKALVFLKSGPELIATAFALFKLGALPVMLDPGMGKDKMLKCVEHVAPDVFIGIPKAQLARVLYNKSFKSVKCKFTGSGWFPGAPSLTKLSAPFMGQKFKTYPVTLDDTAAILFTSGSTGPAKGVVYQHRIFQAQVTALQKLFDFKPGEEIDVPGYPLFALFDVALGITAVIPAGIDPSKPADCVPAAVVDTITGFNATMCQGSPTIWGKVGNFCKECNIKLPNLKRVITFGAPVSPALLRTWADILPEDGDVYTPYGATECLPIALMRGSEVLQETADLTAEGAGTCVGHPAACTKVKIIKITDDPIKELDSDMILPTDQVGEIIVHGDVTTQEYYNEPEANALSKIPCKDGRKWHRVGDVGYLDDKGRLWFCGRKNHRVVTPKTTIFPVMAEGMANTHPVVQRSAVVGIGKPGEQEPVLIVEPKPEKMPEEEKKEAVITRQILARYDDHEKFGEIRQLLYYDRFPTDPRHNAKIHREELAVWAENELKS